MEIKGLNCPNCGATIKIQAGASLVRCPYCGSTISASYDENESKMREGTQFTDDKTGLPLGKAIIPEGWQTQGFYMEREIDDITPFGTILNTFNPEQTMRMTSQFGERFMYFLGPSLGSMLTNGSIKKKYLDPQPYLQDIAQRLLNISFQPKAFGSVLTYYSQNKSVEAQKIVGRFSENARIVLPDVQCDFRLQNVLVDSVAMSGRFDNQGQEWSLIIAADLYGLEYYDAAPMAALGRGLTGGLGKLLGAEDGPSDPQSFTNVLSESMKAMRSGEEKGIFSMDFYKGGGLVGVMKRQKEKLQNQEINARMQGQQASGQKQPSRSVNPTFGHTKETGKPVDVIEWGAKRIYYAMGPASQEEDLLAKFMIFIGSYRQDQGLDQRLEQYHQQVRQQEQMNNQNAMNYAMQSRAINAQRQAEISRTLSQTSDIIMQGYNNRAASQDRISDKWSQAIRGVDQYTTTDGRTVEHSVTSDHVYQNPYGDTIGVSGTGLSYEDMQKLGLTELEKK